jgi:hypothetical protein
MQVWLLRKFSQRQVEVLAYGHVDGDAGHEFVRSFITEDDIQAECRDYLRGFWRWEVRYVERDGVRVRQLNKVSVF